MTKFQNINIEFKARTQKEVLRSLANFCNVSLDKIKKSDIREIYNQYPDSPHFGISKALWEKFNPNVEREYPSTFVAYRYHNTGSNGTMEWFSKGLLCKDSGIRVFIDNLKKYYQLDFSEYEEKLALKCLEKNKIDNDDGPYAFHSYGIAKANQGFDISEVFSDIGGDSLNSLLIQATQHLLATTIEFWYNSPIKMLDRYVHAYCSIFLGVGCYETASIEINQNIPFENIVSIKPRNKKQKRKVQEDKPSITYAQVSLIMLSSSTNHKP